MAAPAPPGGFTIQDTYEVDPRYAHYFTYAAAGLLGAATLCAIPSASRRLLDGRLPASWGFEGLGETWGQTQRRTKPTTQTARLTPPTARRPTALLYASALLQRVALWTFAPRLGRFRFAFSLSLGSMAVALLVPVALVATLLPEANLTSNSNRAGFLTLATLPWLFLLGGKSTGLSTVAGLSYNNLNFLHRWLGRSALVLVLIHMGLWVTQWSAYGSSYLADRLNGDKERKGFFALACLLLLALPSLSVVRRAEKAGWRVFKCLHVVGFVGLIVAVNRHTIYAWPFTAGVIVVYAVDVAGRAARYRFKPVIIEALEQCGEGQTMTRIRIQGVTEGWRAGQHVRLRLFFPDPPSSPSAGLRGVLHSVLRIGRPLESHPFSITNAPSTLSVVVPPHSQSTFSAGREVVLYAKGHGLGSWTGDLHASASSITAQASSSPKAGKAAFTSSPATTRATAVVDGPYGGLPTYSAIDGAETVMLIAGGSGMSFVMGVLDEVVGRAVRGMRGERCGKGTRTRKIEVIWGVSDQGCVDWFAQTLSEIISTANASGALQVSLSIHLSPRHTSTRSPPTSAKALASISDAVLFPSRCSIASAFDALVQNSINPCSVCADCTCASGPEGCPGDEEACCGSKTAPSESAGGLPRLAKTGGSSVASTSGDEITELPPCCRPAPSDEDEEHEEKPKKGCCGKCRSGGPSQDEAWDASEKTLRGGLDVRRGGLAVVACGPARMLADVRNAVAGLPIAKAVRIGGVEVHCESFGI